MKKPKPKPPADLWAQLGADLLEIGKPAFEITAKSFTFNEFIEKFNITKTAGYSRIHHLQKIGKIKKLGRVASQTYYERIVD